jgi:hypothetical protein
MWDESLLRRRDSVRDSNASVARRGRLLTVNGAPAIGRAALAADSGALRAVPVVESQLFARLNAAPTEEPHAPAHPLGLEVRIAAVIYAFGTGAVESTVEDPTAIEAQEINGPLSARHPDSIEARNGLGHREALAGEFDHLLATRYGFNREYADMVNARVANTKRIF